MSAPFAGIKINRKIRYALLAGTMLSAAALPQASVAQHAPTTAWAQDVIILAQAPAPTQGEPQPKGKPEPKGVQPKGPPPKGAQGRAQPVSFSGPSTAGTR